MTTIRNLKALKCSTLTGKSNLTYHIGASDSGDIHLRVIGNSGGGFFSNEWVAWKDILDALEKATPGNITAITLSKLFKGKSANSAGFLAAVLKHENVIASVKGKKRLHELSNPEAFIEKAQGMIDGDSVAKKPVRKTAGKTTRKKTAPKKAPMAKKKATSRKKTSPSRRKATSA